MKKKMIQINGVPYLVKPVKKLWIGGRVSVKDYEKDFCTDGGYGMQIVLVKGKETLDKMTLTPEQVKDGKYSDARFKEDFAPYKTGFLVNYLWKPDFKSVQFDIFSTLQNMTQV